MNQRPASLQELLRRQERQEIPELNLVVKADVQGSLGALTDAFLKLPQDEVRVNLVHSGAGAITEHDVDLAKTAAAIVVGFNVRPNANARELAENEGVDIRLYRVIYDAIDDVKAALSGMLKPEERESILGEAEVRQTFRVPKLGVIAGCYLTRGTIRRNSQVRLIRDGVVVYEGRVGSLRRFKDDVAEVREGFECGIGLENFQDVKEGDVIEAFEVRGVRPPDLLMLVAALRLDLRIPACGSLKEKRHVIKTLTNGIRSTSRSRSPRRDTRHVAADGARRGRGRRRRVIT